MKPRLALFELSTVAAAPDAAYCYPCGLALLPDGRLMACFTRAWRDAESGRTRNAGAISFSEDLGVSWSAAPTVLFGDDAPFETPPAGKHDFGDPCPALIDGRLEVFCQSVCHGEHYDLSKSYQWRRESLDSGMTWSPARLDADYGHSYFAGMNHKALKLSDGSYVRGFSWDRQADAGLPTNGEGDQHYESTLLRSTDGETWLPGGSVSVAARREGALPYAIHGAGEPAYVESAPGELYMLARTGDGFLYETRSHDAGITWDSPRPSPFTSHNCPCELIRLRSGAILAIYNDHPLLRARLSARVSYDGCRTWAKPKAFAPVGFMDEEEAAYPAAEELPDGCVAVVWGQYLKRSAGDRYKIVCARFTPEWLEL